jgi:hypothetical protein
METVSVNQIATEAPRAGAGITWPRLLGLLVVCTLRAAFALPQFKHLLAFALSNRTSSYVPHSAVVSVFLVCMEWPNVVSRVSYEQTLGGAGDP